MPAISEFELQRAVAIHLTAHAAPGVVWWHTPNGGRRNAWEGGRFKALGVKPGVHDLLFLKTGGLYGLELKKPGEGVTSADQHAMHAAMLAAGMIASTVCDDLMEAKIWLRRYLLTGRGV